MFVHCSEPEFEGQAHAALDKMQPAGRRAGTHLRHMRGRYHRHIDVALSR
jgi:hypothetical protein